MSGTYQFRPARRANAKPLIGIYSESGCGKTYGSLLLARGFVGSSGNIGIIETEAGRGEAYAEPSEYPELAGGDGPTNYQVLGLIDPFSPANYAAAITAAEQVKLDALIIDSASHEWEGAGGVLSMAAAAQASGKKGPLVWQQPKLEHQRNFMLRFMQTPIPLVILCMRARYPMVEHPKGTWKKSEVLVPKQSEDILFEMFAHGWVDKAHNFQLTKCTAKGLEPVLQSGKPITLETGKQMKAWAAGTKPATTNGSAATTHTSPFVIHKGSSDYFCVDIEEYQEKMLSAIAALSGDKVTIFYEGNKQVTDGLLNEHVDEITAVQSAFSEKMGQQQ